MFITIDDGFWIDDRVAALIEREHLPVSMFLIGKVFPKHLSFFKRLAAAGAIVENHTVSHLKLTHSPPTIMKHEICDAAAGYQHYFGRSPTIVRPPGGYWDKRFLRIAGSCGMTAVLMWSSEMKGGRIDKSPAAGDVILMHFRNDLYANLTNLLADLKRKNLTVARLEDYIPSGSA
ncbi:MAG: hypothetical protein NVSMB57_07700 [Actinomycetota bacterium]